MAGWCAYRLASRLTPAERRDVQSFSEQLEARDKQPIKSETTGTSRPGELGGPITRHTHRDAISDRFSRPNCVN